MDNVFLYLYPLKEYIDMFLYDDDSLYDAWDVPRPLPIINETIKKRYRDNGFRIIIAIYPDKDIFGIDVYDSDEIIFTDIPFTTATGYYPDGTVKPNEEIVYPSEEYLLKQLGNVKSLVIGGFHFSDCVKRVAKKADEKGIDTLIDLDLTDLFFGLYRKKDYFDVSSYDPNRFLTFMRRELEILGEKEEFVERQLKKMYGDSVYGMTNFEKTK